MLGIDGYTTNGSKTMYYVLVNPGVLGVADT